MGPAKPGNIWPDTIVNCINTGDDQGALCGPERYLCGPQNRSGGQSGQGGAGRWHRDFGHHPLGHPNRDIDMHRAGLARRRQRNRLGHARTHGPRSQPKAALDHRTQHCLMVKHLMGIGFRLRRIDTSGQKDKRHPVLHRIGHDIYGIGDTGAQRGHQHRQGPGHMPQPLGHEPTAVFMLDQHKAQTGLIQPLHQSQNFTPRNAKGMGGTCAGKGRADDRGTCHFSHGHQRPHCLLKS